MSTPLFQPVASVMFVGGGEDLADQCATALPHLAVVRVTHAPGAVARMLVTHPLVVVVDEGISESDVADVIACAKDIRAEVLRASAELRADLGAQIRAAAVLAEIKRAGAAGS